MDTSEAEVSERIKAAEKIADQYKIPEKLKTRMIKQMGFVGNTEQKEVQDMLK